MFCVWIISPFLLGIAVWALRALWKTSFRKRLPDEPPVVPGNMLLGNAAEFSSNAVQFLHAARLRLGNVFTIRLLNQYLTVVMDPHSYEAVSREKNFSFDRIREQVNHNVFNYDLLQPKKILTETARTMKGGNLVASLRDFADHLERSYQNLMKPIAKGSDDLVKDATLADCHQSFWVQGSKCDSDSVSGTVLAEVKSISKPRNADCEEKRASITTDRRKSLKKGSVEFGSSSKSEVERGFCRDEIDSAEGNIRPNGVQLKYDNEEQKWKNELIAKSYEDELKSGLNCGMKSVDNNGVWKEQGLRSFTSSTMFKGIFHTIFGQSDEKSSSFNSSSVFRCFETFHRYFNYLWLGFPVRIFPKASTAINSLLCMPDSEEFLGRDDISVYLRKALQFMRDTGQSELDMKSHNLVYLHVNYNTFRLSFWVLYNLLRHREATTALKTEISDLIKGRVEPMGHQVQVDIEDLESLKVLDSVIQESIRLSSGVFMVRYVTQDTWFTTTAADIEAAEVTATSSQTSAVPSAADNKTAFPATSSSDEAISDQPTAIRVPDSSVRRPSRAVQTSSSKASPGKFLIRKGDRVAMYPPATHHDPAIFPDPEVFRYDRFMDTKFYSGGRRLKHPVMGFGTLCPGRRYALLQLKWFILTVINRFDFQPLGENETATYDTKYYGHEILPPISDVTIKYRLNESYSDLILSSNQM